MHRGAKCAPPTSRTVATLSGHPAQRFPVGAERSVLGARVSVTPRAGRDAASVRIPVGAERSVLGARVSVTPRAGRDAARDR